MTMTETAKTTGTTSTTTPAAAKPAAQPEKAAATAPASKEPAGNVETVEATVIKVGKQRKRRIRQLKRGEGRLAQKVDMTLGQVTSMLGAELEGKKVIPVILLYREKTSRGGGK